VKIITGAFGTGAAAKLFHVKIQLQLPGLEKNFTGNYDKLTSNDLVIYSAL
jgi:hypothetical protein